MWQTLCTQASCDERIYLLTLKRHSLSLSPVLRGEAVVSAPLAQCQAPSAGTIISRLPEEPVPPPTTSSASTPPHPRLFVAPADKAELVSAQSLAALEMINTDWAAVHSFGTIDAGISPPGFCYSTIEESVCTAENQGRCLKQKHKTESGWQVDLAATMAAPQTKCHGFHPGYSHCPDC